MNKIGLKIRRYKDGPADIISPVNPGDWTKKVVDIRATLNLYANNDMSSFATFMSFGRTGTYITIARLIGGRGGENVAAWLFIPNTITVDGKRVVNLVKAVKGELLKTKIDENTINQWFSDTYSESQFAQFRPSKPMGANAPTAKRTYGIADNPSLEQLVGENRYQPYYAEYAAILLTGTDSLPLDPGASASVKDLTQPLKEYGTLLPPAQGSLPAGAKAYINSSEFVMPMMFEKGKVKIKLTRPDYEDCIDSISLSEKCQQYRPAGLKWSKRIYPRNIRIVDETGNPVKNAQITINDGGVNASVAVPEESLSQVHITVNCTGYKQADANHYDLTRGPATVHMKRTAPPTGGNGGCSRRELEEARKTGFEQGRKSGLFTGILSTIAVFALAAAAYAIHYFWGEKELQKQETLTQTEGAVTDETSDEENKPESYAAANDSTKAFNYLKNCNGHLNKDDMAKIKYLDGLWDDLNDFNLEAITGKWNDKLGEKGGEYFVNIVTHAKECSRKGLRNKARQKYNGHYNPDNDPDIYVQNYCNWINDGCGKQDQKQNSSATPARQEKAAKQTQGGTYTPIEQNRGNSNNPKNSGREGI